MTKRILVVDDDLKTVKLVGIVLDRRGYNIIAARTGEQALEKARAEAPDLIVLDIMMPDINGYEVSRRLRADPETADVPILMFSAKTEVQDKVAGFEAGADDYLTKPIHPQELVSRVEALLLRSTRGQPVEKPTAPNVIGFLGSKGGVGTTTLAVNAAIALASGEIPQDEEEQTAGDKRVMLAEMQSGMATACFLLGLPERDGLGTVLDKPIGQIEAGFIEAQLDEHQSGLLVLGSRTDPIGTGASISPDHADAIVRHLGAAASYLLLDLGVGLGEVNRRILSRCRHVVVTIEPDNVALTLAEKLLAEMNQSLNIPRHKISLALIKRNRSATSFTKETVEERLNHNLIGMIPPAPELAFQSANQRSPMVLMDLDSLVVRQYRNVARGLVEAL
jgi:pilus assembly protein CpaE